MRLLAIGRRVKACLLFHSAVGSAILGVTEESWHLDANSAFGELV